jgi:hypothetical protein
MSLLKDSDNFETKSDDSESLYSLDDDLNSLTENINIPTLRNNLNGKFTELQKNIARTIGFYHVTYEHGHVNINSSGMLLRNQSWGSYLKILVKYLVKFLPYLVFYNILRLFYFFKQKKNKINYIYK